MNEHDVVKEETTAVDKRNFKFSGYLKQLKDAAKAAAKEFGDKAPKIKITIEK